MPIYRIAIVCMTLALSFSQASALVTDTNIWINEFHYDNSGGDVNEFVEVVAPSGFVDLSTVQLDFYNGSNGGTYDSSQTLDNFVVGNTTNGFTFYTLNTPAFTQLQNGSPDGLSLSVGGTVVQFLSYEGDFTATNGIANGLMSTNVGGSEGGSAPLTSSVQLQGTGDSLLDFSPTWVQIDNHTAGAVNTGQTVGTPPANPVINEFVANHTGSDDSEFIEIFGDPNADYSAFTVLEIEGDGGGTGTIDGVFNLGTTDGSGFFTFGPLSNELENGTISLLLVKDFIGSQGDDLDTDNDGVFDSMPWSAIVDDIGVNDGGASDINYSVVTLLEDFDGGTFTVGGASRIADGFDTDSVSDWVRNDFSTPPFGTPNVSNPDLTGGNAVPEPTTLALLGFAGLAISRRRRTA